MLIKKTRTAFTGTLQVVFLIIFMHKHILNECSSMGGIVKKRSRGPRRSFYYNPLKMNPNFNINYLSLWRLFSFHS